uniref:Centrosome-associated protein 350-like n=1 Tax=Saccoglossus kowalevskii TaxID=10224 RepID=A0ABM0GU69_SACKO|nr:PREDICTED: centrosome-associated protein 350-like [Saccoglossus kowalevskii]
MSTLSLETRVVQQPVGFRTVTPRPLVTQHNKHLLGTRKELTLSTEFGETYSVIGTEHSSVNSPGPPFVPNSPSDVSVGSLVKFSRPGGRISNGLVKFKGYLPGRSGIFLGVEMQHENGKHDGVFNEERYFKCRANKGIFISYQKVILVRGN